MTDVIRLDLDLSVNKNHARCLRRLFDTPDSSLLDVYISEISQQRSNHIGPCYEIATPIRSKLWKKKLNICKSSRVEALRCDKNDSILASVALPGRECTHIPRPLMTVIDVCVDAQDCVTSLSPAS